MKELSQHLGLGESCRGQNSLLRFISADGLERLSAGMRTVDLASQQVLYRPGERISSIYFPDTAVLCMLTTMEDGRSLESATVGYEGASWVSASLGSPTMPCQTMVCVGGTARKVKARLVENEIRQNGQFHDLLTEYSHALLIASLRTGACNAMHTMTQRCSRWMLMTLDRTTTPRFTITQEFLASLIGCNRPGLNGILGELERSGCIATTRGHIEVIDRVALEAATCECYQILHRNEQEMERRQQKTVLQRNAQRQGEVAAFAAGPGLGSR